MMRTIFIVTGCMLSAFLTACASALSPSGEVYIRINQMGYFPQRIKNGIIFSNEPIRAQSYSVIEAQTKKTVFKATLSENLGTWGNYPYHYRIDFSAIESPGRYYILFEKIRSPEFFIGNDIYSGVADSLLEFFKVQRCGPTNPKLHRVCHLYDSPVVVGDPSVKGADVTGGWHDAGDYTKFLNTTAFSTYMMLLAYELNKPASEFDHNKNGEPDLLEEAKVGLDWLLRCNYSGNKLINQVQNNRDHEVGWRLPENDPLKYERPAFRGLSKNLIGIYSAALSLGARIWKERFSETAFSMRLLETAEKVYSVRNYVPDLDTTSGGMYQDKSFAGKLSLGAIELYVTTGKQAYLSDAVLTIQKTPADYWWSWGDVNSLAHFRMAQFNPESVTILSSSVANFNSNRAQKIFNECAPFGWGSTHTFLGAALQALLLRRISPESYDSLIIQQLDYLFGNNPWGISFVYGFGKNHVKRFHSQVAYFNGGYLPGAISAGPAPKSLLAAMDIKRTPNELTKFNSDETQFFDDRLDYVTNEPTIATNATAVFVFLDSYFSHR